MKTLRELGTVQMNSELADRKREWCLLARAIVASYKDSVGVQQSTELSPRIKRIIASGVHTVTPAQIFYQRAAVSAGTTIDLTWAAPLAEYGLLANSFVEALRNFGAFDRMLADMFVVPMRVRVGMVTAGSVASATSQASAKIISKLTLTNATMDEKKATTFTQITEELLRFSDKVAGDLFQRDMVDAVSQKTDEYFLTILTSGAPSFSSSGATAEHVRNDLRVALSNVTTGQRSRLYLITTSAIAKTISVMNTTAGDAAFPTVTYRGGNVSGIEILVSDGCPTGTAILADARQIAASSEGVTLDASKEAIIQMEDSSPDSPITANTVMRPTWQNNEVSLRAERWFSAAKLSTTGVCVIQNIGYTGDSPGP